MIVKKQNRLRVGLKRTQIKTYSTEINKFKRQSPNDNGYMLPHYLEETVENVNMEKNDQSCY